MRSKHDIFKAFTHYIMSFTGGYLCIYALIIRSGVLGCAQTGNLLNLVCSLLAKDYSDCLIRIGAVCLYVSGIAFTTVLMVFGYNDLRPASICITGLMTVISGFLPENINPVLALYPMFFASSVQWCSFNGLDDMPSSTVFSTNNLRQLTAASITYFIKRKPGHREKLLFYTITILVFHIGAGAAWFFSTIFGTKSCWLCLLPIVFASFTLCQEYGATQQNLSVSKLYNNFSFFRR